MSDERQAATERRARVARMIAWQDERRAPRATPHLVPLPRWTRRPTIEQRDAMSRAALERCALGRATREDAR